MVSEVRRACLLEILKSLGSNLGGPETSTSARQLDMAAG